MVEVAEVALALLRRIEVAQRDIQPNKDFAQGRRIELLRRKLHTRIEADGPLDDIALAISALPGGRLLCAGLYP